MFDRPPVIVVSSCLITEIILAFSSLNDWLVWPTRIDVHGPVVSLYIVHSIQETSSAFNFSGFFIFLAISIEIGNFFFKKKVFPNNGGSKGNTRLSATKISCAAHSWRFAS